MSAVSPEARASLNHIMSCRNCYAPGSRYCPEGLELHLDALAEFIATRESKHEQHRIYRRERELHPERAERLGELVKARLEAMRGSASDG